MNFGFNGSTGKKFAKSRVEATAQFKDKDRNLHPADRNAHNT